MDNNQQLREDFAAMVKAVRSYALPWQIATGVLAVIAIALTVAIAVR